MSLRHVVGGGKALGPDMGRTALQSTSSRGNPFDEYWTV